MNKQAMHGDVIEFNGMRCEVSIRGSQGTYITKDGTCINVAQGNEGFLRDIDRPGAEPFRAQWSEYTKVLTRKHPEMFS